MKFKDTKYGDLTGQTYDGDISVAYKKLTSLEGAPEIVNGNFDCSYNKLTSLKYTPYKVDGYFNCSRNQLTSLEDGPETVEGFFDCSRNQLISLKGAPEEVKGFFYCSDNPLTQSEVDKLVKIHIKGKIKLPDGLIAPTKNDYRLYKKLGDKKYFKLKELKAKLK